MWPKDGEWLVKSTQQLMDCGWVAIMIYRADRQAYPQSAHNVTALALITLPNST